MAESTSTASSQLGVARSPGSGKGETPESNVPKVALAAGGLLAVLATFCCGPLLLLVSLGLGGAWLSGSLEVLAPLRPYLIAATIAVLGFAGWRIHRPATACAPGAACAVSKSGAPRRVIFWVVAVLALAMVTFPYYGWLFV